MKKCDVPNTDHTSTVCRVWSVTLTVTAVAVHVTQSVPVCVCECECDCHWHCQCHWQCDTVAVCLWSNISFLLVLLLGNLACRQLRKKAQHNFIHLLDNLKIYSIYWIKNVNSCYYRSIRFRMMTLMSFLGRLRFLVNIDYTHIFNYKLTKKLTYC